jgi:hypothetical protein
MIYATKNVKQIAYCDKTKIDIQTRCMTDSWAQSGL